MGDTLLGTTIDGRYLVKRFIGRGGMGAVYEGEQVALGRRVAIKVMTRDLADAYRERFRREARLASRVIHEHVAQVFDVSTTPDGHELIVMEYVEGRTLGDVMDEGPLDPTRAIAITRAMLVGLAAIHDQGIVHRDIKPGNVMLTTRGSDREFVKIVDFGVARGGGEASLTNTGHAVGTPHFMSPEQFRGGNVDLRTDIYAVGVTLFAMLAARMPFTGDTAELGAQHVFEDAPSLDAVRPGLPPWLVAAVARALAKAPADRFANARDFAAALAPPRKRRRRWPWALVLAAIVAGGAVGAYFARRSTPAETPVVADAAVSDAAVVDAAVVDAAVVDAAVGDAGIIVTKSGQKVRAATSKPSGMCHCIPTKGPDNIPLCPSKGTPLCRCDDDNGFSLCATKLIPCDPHEKYEPERDRACSNWRRLRCPDLGWKRFTKPGKQGEACVGYHIVRDLDGPEPLDAKHTGHLECDTCPSANTRIFRGAAGSPCTGYYWHTGEQMQGTLQQCE